MIKVASIDGSPSDNSRSRTLADAIAAGVGNCQVSHHRLCEGITEAVELLRRSDAVVLTSPVFRAGVSSLTKQLLDSVPRGMYPGEEPPALESKPVAIGMVGADWSHFLALDSLRNVLMGFFGAWVVPPGCYVPAAAWSGDALDTRTDSFACGQGALLGRLTCAVQSWPNDGLSRPQC